jgi:hypothetical protein
LRPAQRINLANAGWASDIHFGQPVTNDVDPDEPQTVLAKQRCQSRTDLVVSLCHGIGHDGRASSHVATKISTSGDTTHDPYRVTVKHDHSTVTIS